MNNGENKWLVKDGSVFAKFSSGLKSEAIMQSPIFSKINSKHRQRDSSSFGACKVNHFFDIDFILIEKDHSLELFKFN